MSIPILSAADLGQAIRRQRKSDGLTLAEAAGLTNVGIRFLSELQYAAHYLASGDPRPISLSLPLRADAHAAADTVLQIVQVIQQRSERLKSEFSR